MFRTHDHLDRKCVLIVKGEAADTLKQTTRAKRAI